MFDIIYILYFNISNDSRWGMSALAGMSTGPLCSQSSGMPVLNSLNGVSPLSTASPPAFILQVSLQQRLSGCLLKYFTSR